MEDFFSEVIPPTMTGDEFVSKTKELLNKIIISYGSAHGYRKITEEEFKVTPCDSCKGEMSFEFCGKTVNCVADNREGECYERVFDKDEFSETVEDIIFHQNSNFFDLMESKVTEPVLAVAGSEIKKVPSGGNSVTNQ